MNIRCLLSLIVLASTFGQNAATQPVRRSRAAVSAEVLSLYQPGVYRGLPYRLMKPIDYDPSQSYPLVLSLHGAGGRGKNNLSNLRNWNELMANESLRRKHPCFVLVPQTTGPWLAPDSAVEDPSVLSDQVREHLSESMLNRLEERRGRLDEIGRGDLGTVIELLCYEIQNRFKIDPNRLYCLGHSMGGAGTFTAIYHYPDLFAAAIPTAGFSNPGRDYTRIANLPIWAFHGDNDPTVPYEATSYVFARMKELGGNMKFTTLNDIKHAAAIPAFSYSGDLPAKGFTTAHASARTDKTENIWDWLFSQTLKKQGRDGYQWLFNGNDLTNWQQTGGKAKFYVEDHSIVGEAVTDSPSSFLCTRQIYDDFELIAEFKADGPLNSGIQFRSHVYAIEIDYPSTEKKKHRTLPAGRIHGYQAEIDSNQTSRVWTAGIFDQSRRGWLFPGPKGGHPDQFASQGQTLYRPNRWNEIKIRCQGPRIQTWLNGIQRADFNDSLSASGIIAIQIHGIGKKPELAGESVRFRRLRLKPL